MMAIKEDEINEDFDANQIQQSVKLPVMLRRKP